jgi:hypothetical protein
LLPMHLLAIRLYTVPVVVVVVEQQCNIILTYFFI